MVCDLPAGSTHLHSPVAMLNLLGDIWPSDGIPAWDEVLQQDLAKLHLYGKKEARPGRKMGHINCLGASREETISLLEKVRQLLN
jgi:5-(carboxyamino)imidazole ribonucleotide synthase